MYQGFCTVLDPRGFPVQQYISSNYVDPNYVYDRFDVNAHSRSPRSAIRSWTAPGLLSQVGPGQA